MKKNYFDLFRVWVRNYFRHPIPNIRQEKPIVPGRLYRNFGNICKAVRYRQHEQDYIQRTEMFRADYAIHGSEPDEILQMVKGVKGDKEAVRRIQRALSQEQDMPAKCELCDFHRCGVPCPIYNVLADGSTVCDTHRYVIIKKAPRYD